MARSGNPDDEGALARQNELASAENARRFNETLSQQSKSARQQYEVSMRNARTQQEQGIVLGNTAANVAEALSIARTIHDTTTHQAGEAEKASTNIHETAVRVSEVVNDLGPLLNLLAALKGGKAPKK